MVEEAALLPDELDRRAWRSTGRDGGSVGSGGSGGWSWGHFGEVAGFMMLSSGSLGGELVY